MDEAVAITGVEQMTELGASDELRSLRHMARAESFHECERFLNFGQVYHDNALCRTAYICKPYFRMNPIERHHWEVMQVIRMAWLG